MSPRRLPARLRAWGVDERGVAAVEFALMVPFLLIVYLGGVQTFQSVTMYRKVSDATIELANVTSQYQTMSTSDFSNVFNAISQIMSPYATPSLQIVLTIITTDVNNNAKVAASCGFHGGTPLVVGSTYSAPAGLTVASSTYVLAQTQYSYVPIIAFGVIGNSAISDKIYMQPRNSATITVTGTCPTS